MRFLPLVFKIISCLVFVAVAVAGSVGVTLYLAAVERTESVLVDQARTAAALIDAIAEYDLKYSIDERATFGFGATLAQVRAGFQALDKIHAATEFHFVAAGKDNTVVRVHHFDGNVLKAPEVIDRGSDYGKAVTRGLTGETGLAYVHDDHGLERMLIAFAPVTRMQAAVVFETPAGIITAPFVQAAGWGAVVGFLVITFGAAYTYSQTGPVVRAAVETSRRLAAEQAESEKARNQLAAALEASSQGFALFDRDDRLVVFNEVYRGFFEATGTRLSIGMTFEEMLRARLRVGAYKVITPDAETFVARRLERRRNPQGAFEHQIADGRWLQISERRTKDGGIVSSYTDITELKRKQFELQESQQRFRDFTETASDWIWETDEDFRFTEISAGKNVSHGFDVTNAIGRTREELAAEDTTTPKWQALRRRLAEYQPFRNFEYRFVSGDGRVGFASVSGIPVFDETGKFKGYRGTATDVSAMRAQEDRIEAAEERFRSAFDNVTVGIVVADDRGTIRAFNPAATRMFGYGEEEVVGANVRMLMPPPDHDRHDTYIRNYLDTGERKVIGIGREVVGLRKNGEVFPLFLGLAEVKLRGERQFIASINDLSPVRALELQLRQAQKMETVGQLVGGIAHDFNNLLGIIIGNLDLARRKVEEDTRLHGQIEKAMNAANRGATLTRRLLNFSRQAPAASEAVDVNALIRNVRDLIQRSLTQNIEVRLDLADGELPAMADAGDLEDSLVNIALNARDAMPEGGILHIETNLRTIDPSDERFHARLREGTYVEIAVTDTGVGIPKENLARVFDPFFSTKTKDKGTGLGLSMVYGFAKRSNGLVSVYSEEGVGTTFRLYLPVADQPVAARAAPGEADQPAGGTETILVVDDEVDLAEVAETFLGRLGYTVIVAHNGAEALAILNGDTAIDLLLTDVIMPGGVSGHQLAVAAAQLRPGMAICLASGFTGNALGDSHSNADFPILRKPYRNRELAAMVRSLLDRSG